jgi:hypothetical protein
MFTSALSHLVGFVKGLWPRSGRPLFTNALEQWVGCAKGL